MSEKLHAIEIHSVEEFNKFLDLSATTPLIVYFFASYVPNCQMMKPHIEQLAKDFEGQAIFLKIEEAEENEELLAKYDITDYPVTKIIKDGQIVGFLRGMTKDSILEAVK